ncbi:MULTISPECIES: PIN domain-containing protein [unclassified Calothrix]|uniref:PIN domain-containing protein n=1 Tax=unclassified Calothrix TaxID=2619626 RepID=UPI001F553E37|nr:MULTISPECIES: PIN domain-containing protein [unclassified Calothrix]
MAIAKGQDLEAENLLSSLSQSIQIAIPDICYVEALNRWEKEKYYVQEFEKELNKQINNSERDLTSPNANSFLMYLEQTRILNKSLLNDIQSRLLNAIDVLLKKAEIITLDTSIIRNISEAVILQPDTLLIKQDIMDNLILQCIINHAKSSYSTEKKVFLSGNSKDFGKREVKQALKNAGIKYLTNTQDFLAWLNSQSS